MGPLSEITPMLEQEKVCTHNNIPMKLDHDAHHPNEISTEKSCPISTHSNSEQSQLVTIQDQSDNPVVHCDQPVSNGIVFTYQVLRVDFLISGFFKDLKFLIDLVNLMKYAVSTLNT